MAMSHPSMPLTAVALSALLAWMVAADTSGEPPADPGRDAQGPRAFHTDFQFARLQHSMDMGRVWGRERWLTDWPEAELHLLLGINRITRIDAAHSGRLVSIMDEDLFDYPFLYAVEPGQWRFTKREAARLRDYLLRGGFLLVDDFHGSFEWQGFATGLRQIFPDRQIVEIPRDDSLFHTVYDLSEPTPIPGIGAALSGVTWERDGMTPHWRGVYDDEGRLMVVINFNMDLGDGWEHADVPEYALRYTGAAYRHAINYIVYAMTH